MMNLIRNIIETRKVKKYQEDRELYRIKCLSDELADDIIIHEANVDYGSEGVLIPEEINEIGADIFEGKKYADIIAMCKFLRRHKIDEPVDQDLFNKIIKNGDKFEFLKELNKQIPNLVEQTLKNDAKYIAMLYIELPKFKKNEKYKK